MGRPRLAAAMIALKTAKSLFSAFRREGLQFAFTLAIVVFLLAVLFAFLAFTPVLSPFVYPLF